MRDVGVDALVEDFSGERGGKSGCAIAMQFGSRGEIDKGDRSKESVARAGEWC